MTASAESLRYLPCDDSEWHAQSLTRELDMAMDRAADLGRSAVAVARDGFYLDTGGQQIKLKNAIQHACAAKVSLSPDASLPHGPVPCFGETVVQVSNATALATAKRFVQNGKRPLVLNFANGVQPGGGFLVGAQAQEEILCRSSILFETLVGDPMYDHHREECPAESSDWAILSPDVPVFRTDGGTALDQSWVCSFLTCAAPYAPAVGPTRSAQLLARRIERVLAIARAYGFHSLVLGAWGCGAYENDPEQTARDFHQSLSSTFAGSFDQVVFAIVDRSRERGTLDPFRRVFSVA